MTGIVRKCIVCYKPIDRLSRRRLFCSTACAHKAEGAADRRHGRFESSAPVDTGTLGAMAELLVCTDLMDRGYEVFRALSPSASCDLIALKQQFPLRVQVRCSHRGSDGVVRGLDLDSYKHHDLAALVLAGGEIVYGLPDGRLSESPQ